MSRKNFIILAQVGLKALGLAKQYRDVLEPRLPGGTIDALESDVDALTKTVPTVPAAHAASKATTAQQNVALADGHRRVVAVRLVVQRSGADAGVRAAYGVGMRTSPKIVKQVTVAIQHVLDRAGARPDEAAALGIQPEDLEGLREALAAIQAADSAQEKARASAPAPRRERDAIAGRIRANVGRIAAAGVIAFPRDPETSAHFRRLLGAGHPPRPRVQPAPQTPPPANN